MRMIHLKCGWNTPDFDFRVMASLNAYSNDYEYYDIKIDSKGENCMLILKKRGVDRK